MGRRPGEKKEAGRRREEERGGERQGDKRIFFVNEWEEKKVGDREKESDREISVSFE